MYVSVCMSVYVCQCVYVSVCMPVYVCQCMYVSVCMSVCVYQCMHGSMCMSVCVCQCMHASVCTSVSCMYVSVCTSVYVSWCGGKSWVDQRVPRAYIHDVALLLRCSPGQGSCQTLPIHASLISSCQLSHFAVFCFTMTHNSCALGQLISTLWLL